MFGVADLSLSSRLPVELLPEAQRLLRVHKINFELVPNEKQPWIGIWSYPAGEHKIQILDTLTGLDFFETLIHEMAHATKWDKMGRRGQDHGVEWKAEYRRLMKPFLTLKRWTPEEKARFSKPTSKKPVDLEKLKEKYPEHTFLIEFNVGQEFIYGGKSYVIKRKGCVNFTCVSSKDPTKRYKLYKLSSVLGPSRL